MFEFHFFFRDTDTEFHFFFRDTDTFENGAEQMIMSLIFVCGRIPDSVSLHFRIVNRVSSVLMFGWEYVMSKSCVE